MSMMGAKDSGFILQESHNAVMEEMSGHVGINSRKRIIEEIYFFVLDIKKKHQEDLGQLVWSFGNQSWIGLNKLILEG